MFAINTVSKTAAHDPIFQEVVARIPNVYVREINGNAFDLLAGIAYEALCDGVKAHNLLGWCISAYKRDASGVFITKSIHEGEKPLEDELAASESEIESWRIEAVPQEWEPLLDELREGGTNQIANKTGLTQRAIQIKLKKALKQMGGFEERYFKKGKKIKHQKGDDDCELSI